MSAPKIELGTHEAYYADQMLTRLKDAVKTAGSQAALAKRIGISPQFLNDMLRGNRTVGGKALEFLGFAEITVYYRIGGWR
jgi:transcriptional regulator with XRE-family HTH domain